MTLPATPYTYQLLQPFTSKEQLNANTIAIREQFNDIFKPATKKVLDFLHTHACKFYGVCYMSKSKIAKQLELHRSTVIRACEQLEALGIIIQYDTKRVNGDKRQSTNAIVFVHQLAAKEAFIENATPECDTIDTLLDTPILLKNTDDTEEPTEKESEKSLLKEGLKAKLPETLGQVLSPFFDANEMYEVVGTIYKAKASVDKEIRIEDHASVYYTNILSVINAWGRGKAKSLHGVMYKAIQNVTRTIWLKERTNSYFGF
ncbi:helix-turn-helix domain-containing protein [Lysinibacillus sphaericus]|uniref:helix-turn-helix domain-containing protein n=1 Tax=Lysinibacillus sphaericus TaxID=1421 RepID=UPI00068AA56A|nr:helix-turn-helix domain-containing protein [Lysinibacillus sphaericus]